MRKTHDSRYDLPYHYHQTQHSISLPVYHHCGDEEMVLATAIGPDVWAKTPIKVREYSSSPRLKQNMGDTDTQTWTTEVQDYFRA